MRAIWKGNLELGLISVPINLYSAIDSEDLSFRLLHKDDMAPVKYQRVCSADGKKLDWEEIVKGYEYEKGKYAVLREEDFRRIDVEETREVEVLEFVERGDIDPMSFDKPYYLGPGKGGERAYAVMREALLATDKVGIVRLTIRKKPHLGVLHPEKEALAITMLRSHEQIRDAADVGVPAREVKAAELKMARLLIDEMTVKWEPTRHPDEYRARLEDLIEERTGAAESWRKGSKGKSAAAGSRDNVVDLMEALRKSLGSEKGHARAKPARARAASRKTPKRKAS